MQRDSLLISEIIDATERILELVTGATVADLNEDRNRREALLWNFMVLGEATNQLSDVLREQYPALPWRAPTAMRNRIVHGYWQVSLSILLVTAQDDLPGFLEGVKAVRRSLQDAGE